MRHMIMIPLVVALGVTAPLNEAYAKVALAQVRIKVVDQDGIVVPDAKIWGGFTCGGGMNDYVLVDGMTNTNGEFVAQGKCNEFLRVDVTKEGYYQSEVKVNFLRSKADPRVVVGKWQPYGETRTVVLKRIKNPWSAKVHTDEQRHRKIPAFDQWLPFDMEVSDWLAPYGNGVHNDVLLRFNKAGSGRVGDFAFTMDACFTNNPYAGFYSKPLDTFSDLRTDYCADTNADYCTDYRFMIDAIGKGRVKEMGLEKGSYLVFRTRTRVDENGKLVGAHYGKYCGGWRSDNTELHLGAGCFNPIENDTNIEGDQPLLYKIRNYKNKK